MWVSRPAAARASGLTEGAIDKLIRTGRLAIRRVEGSHPRVDLSEVLQLAEAATTPVKETTAR